MLFVPSLESKETTAPVSAWRYISPSSATTGTAAVCTLIRLSPQEEVYLLKVKESHFLSIAQIRIVLELKCIFRAKNFWVGYLKAYNYRKKYNSNRTIIQKIKRRHKIIYRKNMVNDRTSREAQAKGWSCSMPKHDSLRSI